MIAVGGTQAAPRAPAARILAHEMRCAKKKFTVAAQIWVGAFVPEGRDVQRTMLELPNLIAPRSYEHSAPPEPENKRAGGTFAPPARLAESNVVSTPPQ